VYGRAKSRKAQLQEAATGDYICEVRGLINAAGIVFVVIFLIYQLFYLDNQNNLLSLVSILSPLISKKSGNRLSIDYMQWEYYRALIFLEELLRPHHADEVPWDPRRI
jgi:hypothetical protein